MRAGGGKRELLRVVHSEEAEIDVGNDVSWRRCLRPRISMGAATPAKKQQGRNENQEKTNFQTFAFHE